MIHSMIKTGVEGIIFASCTLHDRTVEKLIDDHLPVVWVNRKLKKDKGDYVILDNTYGQEILVIGSPLFSKDSK